MAELMPEFVSQLMTEPLKAGGELLLFVLFVLFSVGSALLERRKRKRQAEQSGQASSAPGAPLTDEEEEETGSWPFPMGGDPFDLPKPKQRPARRPGPDGGGEVTAAPEPPAPSASAPRLTHIEQMEEEAREVKRLQEVEAGDGYGEAARPDPLQELERRALEAELRAREVEEAARAAERQAQQVQPRRRVRELVEERIERDQEQRAGKKRRPKWLLTPKTARDAMVYTVILGRPKADRKGEDFR